MAGDHDGLWEAAREFVDDVTAAMSELSGRPPDSLRHDVTVEAANLVAAFIDVDERQTDAELWAYTGAFDDQLATQPGRGHAGRAARVARAGGPAAVAR